MKAANIKWWVLWLISSVLLGGYFSYALWLDDSGRAEVFLPGESSHGHYQIELACSVCHGEAFDGPEVMQQACLNCHQQELYDADDSHPIKKFRDPRNADRLAILDATMCVTCHGEHDREITREMGVTLSDDFCILCHENVADDRPSHKEKKFDNCSSAGCHNYHDNKALYEDFLIKHANEPSVLPEAKVPARNFDEWFTKTSSKQITPLKQADADAPDYVTLDPLELSRWQASAHAKGGVNCTECHYQIDESGVSTGQWLDRPELMQCKACHKDEVSGFEAGRHGMKMAQGLPAMTPAEARQEMHKGAYNLNLGCNSCHDGHAYYLRQAAFDRCVECHDDQHSSNYNKSKHYILWRQEQEGLVGPGAGVSCATCHMPRMESMQRGETRVTVTHNQNMNLRPNEKMIRSVCMNCHGYQFSVNSLADEVLIKNNFSTPPTVNVESQEMALKREQEKAGK